MATLTEALFLRVLGPAFDTLPGEVRRLHLARGARRYDGEVEVERGSGVLARLMAAATRLPPAGHGAVTVEMEADATRERWVRHIGGRAMPSRLWGARGLLCERLGLVTLGFRLEARDGELHWRVARAAALGLPLPAAWFAGVSAREYAQGGRYHFDVRAAMPLAGLLVHYHGWLHVD